MITELEKIAIFAVENNVSLFKVKADEVNKSNNRINMRIGVHHR